MPKATARQVVLELIKQTGGNWVGKTRLFKAFYFAHLFYAGTEAGILTNWPIARMPQGPGIHNSHELLSGLEKDGRLQIELTNEGPYPEYRYRLGPSADMEQGLPDHAKEAVKKAAEFVSNHTAAELSQLTHDYSRSWNEGKDGDVLDIYVDLIPDDEYLEEKQKLLELDRQLQEILS